MPLGPSSWARCRSDAGAREARRRYSPVSSNSSGMNKLLSPRRPLEDRDCPLGRIPPIDDGISDAATTAQMRDAQPWNVSCIQRFGPRVKCLTSSRCLQHRHGAARPPSRAGDGNPICMAELLGLGADHDERDVGDLDAPQVDLLGRRSATRSFAIERWLSSFQRASSCLSSRGGFRRRTASASALRIGSTLGTDSVISRRDGDVDRRRDLVELRPVEPADRRDAREVLVLGRRGLRPAAEKASTKRAIATATSTHAAAQREYQRRSKLPLLLLSGLGRLDRPCLDRRRSAPGSVRRRRARHRRRRRAPTRRDDG